MKIMTILGTRPEIIRLYCVIQKLDKFCSHILVHTGQNYDYEINKVFFDDLDLREPDYILNVKANKLYKQLSNIFEQTGNIIEKEMPLSVSNVMLICPHCLAPTKIAFKELGDGSKGRVCKKCPEVIE